MSISSLLVVLSSCAFNVFANAIPDPMITAAAVLPRQDSGQRFIGYYSTTGEQTWDSARCASSSTWTTSGRYGRCCSSGSSCERSDFATSCSRDYAIYPYTSLSCLFTCNTDYIYESSGDSLPTRWVGCASSSRYTSFYRSAPATAVFYPNSVTDDAPTTTSEPTKPVTPIPVVKKKSKIWIVGVVLGVVALLAIIGIVAFILISRKKKKARAAAIAAGQSNYGAPPPGAFQQQAAMQQAQYMQPPPGGMAPMQQPYGAPPPEGGYYTQDPKPIYQGGPPQSPPPPVWTPSQNQAMPNTMPTPTSPQTRHVSLAPSDMTAVEQQRDMTKSPGGTVSEMGSSQNNLGSNPSVATSPGGMAHLSSVGEAVAGEPPKAAHVNGHTNRGASELQ
ncbi:hypothetical protein BJ875DRAFT_106376 [Amylocarpus encephaloides]|uniref:Mid2 domain-containing protein n=1 Tax=Amylocarpus encephaloides TaxID=45428 RepID=A0A9P7YDP6_9HELO|nr:hypothetical protein BJ875DRAFT_106376 [Amylocarpus encephaloides]